MKMTSTEAQTFDRFSVMNTMIAESNPCTCEAYKDIFTYRRWQAIGYQVRKGEHGKRITTWITMRKKDKVTGIETVTGKRPNASTVFCRCQVDPKG